MAHRRRSHRVGAPDATHSLRALAAAHHGRPGARVVAVTGGRARTSLWSWAVGVVVAAAVLGPAWAPGSVFLLDAAFVPRVPVPAGVWGLGPELPRRVPLGLALSWSSTVVGGALAGKLLLGLALVLAFAGAARLVGEAGWATQLTSGLVYSLSPLTLTRVGSGEWTALAAFAVLPWAVPSLLVPSKSKPRTFVWAVAMGATGSVGGILSLLVVAVGVVAEHTTSSLKSGALAVLAQLQWAVPGIVVALSGPKLLGASAFATRARGLVGVAGVVAGHGFWRAPTQVGGDSRPGTALLGIGLLGLAMVGARALAPPWRWRAAAVAGLGFAMAMATAVPGARALYDAVTATAVGAPFRESQRFAVLGLVWLAPAAALGARRLAVEGGGRPPAQGPVRALARWAAIATPMLATLVLALPGLWGVGGQLEAVPMPPDWSAARAAIRSAPGTVLALPYHRYLDLPIAGNRRALNPLPDYLGGDVLASSDPELGAGARELDDPREPMVVALLARATTGGPVGAGLAVAGVRWVVVLHAADWRTYGSLGTDPGLTAVIQGGTLDLFAVTAWRGPVVDSAGRLVALRDVVAPLHLLAPSPPAVWAAPAAWGWSRGRRAAGRSGAGLVRLPAGRGPLWYWPALVVLAVDAATLGALVAAIAAVRLSAIACHTPTTGGGRRGHPSPH